MAILILYLDWDRHIKNNKFLNGRKIHFFIRSFQNRLINIKNHKYNIKKINTDPPSTSVFDIHRVFPGQCTFLIVINLGTEMEMVNLGAGIRNVPPVMKIITGSLNSGHNNG